MDSPHPRGFDYFVLLAVVFSGSLFCVCSALAWIPLKPEGNAPWPPYRSFPVTSNFTTCHLSLIKTNEINRTRKRRPVTEEMELNLFKKNLE
jgi:hypothetical protein